MTESSAPEGEMSPALNIPMRSITLPQSDFARAPHLMGFDYGEHLFHVLAFDFGDDGGALGIWRDGSKFCARISLDALAEFWGHAERGIDTIEPGRALHAAVLEIIEGLMDEDLPEDSPEGIGFAKLAAAVEAYEKATLPPPFGNAATSAAQAAGGGAPMALPDLCDGKEQEAFEQHLRDRGMDTTTHPLHWLFLDARSYAAREAWKAAISYCRTVAAPDHPSPSREGPSDAEMPQIADMDPDRKRADDLGRAAGIARAALSLRPPNDIASVALPDAAKLVSLWFDEWGLILPPDARESFRNDLLPSVRAAGVRECGRPIEGFPRFHCTKKAGHEGGCQYRLGHD